MSMTTVLGLFGITLFLVAGTCSLLLNRKPPPRLQTTTIARRPAPAMPTPNHAASTPIAQQRPAGQAVVTPVKRRCLHNPRVVYQRRLRTIEAEHTLLVVRLERRIAELESKLLEQLVLTTI